MTPRTLCIDDDDAVLAMLKEFLISAGHQVIATTAVEEALHALETKGPFSFCISDFQMPEMQGDDFLRIVAEKSPDTTRVLMSGFASKQRIQQALLDGTCCIFVDKPFRLTNLISQMHSHRRTNERSLSQDRHTTTPLI